MDNIDTIIITTLSHNKELEITSGNTGWWLTFAPGSQASSIVFTGITATSLTFNWTNGDGSSRIVLMKAVSAVNSNPVDGIAYSANSVFGSGSQIGSGNYVVKIGSGPVTVTGLSAGTTYYAAVYELNGSSTSIKYLVPGTTANTTTASFALTSGDFYGDSISFGFSASDPSKRFTSLLCARYGATENNYAQNGQTITAGTAGVFGGSIAAKPAGAKPRIFFAWSYNDAIQATTLAGSIDGGIALFVSSLSSFVTAAKAVNWVTADFVGVSDWDFNGNPDGDIPTRNRYYLYSLAMRNFCAMQGITWVGNFTSYPRTDVVHPNDAGYLSLSNQIYTTLNSAALADDAAALAFESAYSISNAVQMSALNILCVGLKKTVLGDLWDNVLTGMPVYPIVGGSAAAHKGNLRNPGTNDLVFFGSITHSSTGMLSDGSTGYAKTGFIPSVSQANFNNGFSYYSRTNNNTNGFEVGANDGSLASYSGGYFAGIRPFNAVNGKVIQGSATRSDGFFTAVDVSNNHSLSYRNAVQLVDATGASSGRPTVEFYLLAENLNGVATSPTIRQVSSHFFHTGLTAQQVSDLHNIDLIYQTALGRNV